MFLGIQNSKMKENETRFDKRGEDLLSYKNVFPKINNSIVKPEKTESVSITNNKSHNEENVDKDSKESFSDESLDEYTFGGILFRYVKEKKDKDHKFKPFRYNFKHKMIKCGKRVRFLDDRRFSRINETERIVQNLRRKGDINNFRIQIKKIGDISLLKKQKRKSILKKNIKNQIFNGREKLITKTFDGLRQIVQKILCNHKCSEKNLKDTIKNEIEDIFDQKIKDYIIKNDLKLDDYKINKEHKERNELKKLVRNEILNVEHLITNLVENKTLKDDVAPDEISEYQNLITVHKDSSKKHMKRKNVYQKSVRKMVEKISSEISKDSDKEGNNRGILKRKKVTAEALRNLKDVETDVKYVKQPKKLVMVTDSLELIRCKKIKRQKTEGVKLKRKSKLVITNEKTKSILKSTSKPPSNKQVSFETKIIEIP